MVARKQTTIMTCDRDGCKSYSEIFNPNEAPSGWLLVYTEQSNRFVSRTLAREFCSEKCVGIWAGKRRNYLKTNPGEYRNGSPKSTRDQMLEIISMMEDEFDYTNIMELMDDPPSTGAVGQMMKTFSDEGVVKIVKQGGQGIRSKYVRG
jgi:hypothetical protein